MPTTVLPRHSLKNRITLATLAIFLISLWALSFYATRMLHGDMERLSGEQQFSTVSYVASEVDGKLEERINALKLIANAIDASVLDSPKDTQKFLDQRFVLHSLFNDGVFATRADGVAIADSPLSGRRVGINFMDRDYMIATLKEGKPMVGRPVLSIPQQFPVFVISVPIQDTHGKTVGSLSGVTDLGKPNFLDKITANRYGQTGGYLIVAPKYQLIVTATDKSRIMESTPAPGVSPAIDRFNQGYEGSAVYVNPQGIEMLTSVKGVPASLWFVAANLPTAEAFAPIHDMERRMMLATLLLTVLAGGLTWWILRQELLPLVNSAKALANLADTEEAPQPLPVTRPDEIGQLILGFNQLLNTLGKRESDLRESEEYFRLIFENSGDAIIFSQPGGHINSANPAASRLFGYSNDEFRRLGRSGIMDVTDSNLQIALEECRLTGTYRGELRCINCEGHVFIADFDSTNFTDSSGKEHTITRLSDITERRRLELWERTRAKVMVALSGDVPLAEILACIIRAVEAENPTALCSILLLDDAGKHLRLGAAPSLSDFYVQAIDGLEIGEGVGSCGTAAFTGKRVIVADIALHPYWNSFRDLAERAGLGACWSEPIIGVAGHVLGTFSIYQREPGEPDENNLEWMRLATELSCLAIEKSQERAALELERNKLTAAFSNLSVGLVMCDAQGGNISMNPAALKYHDISSVQEMGKKIEDYADDWELHYADGRFMPYEEWPLPRALRGDCVNNYDAVLRNRKTNFEWACSYGSALIRNRDGDVTQIVMTLLDITERNLAVNIIRQMNAVLEQRVQERTAALSESEQSFRTMANNIAQMVWMADAQGSIFWYNQRWFDYTGTTIDEMFGWGWQKVHHPDHVQRVVEKIKHCFETGEIWEDTFPLRGTDGQYRWFLSRAVPIRDESGAVLRWFGTNTDVTESKQLEVQLAEAKRAAEQASLAKSTFLANMSHEIRTPMNAIIGTTHILRREISGKKELERLDNINSAAQQLLGIINAILDLSKIEAGKMVLESRDFDIDRVLLSVADMVRSQAAAKDLELIVDTDHLPPTVHGDGNRLGQILLNFVGNAIKFTDHGRVLLRCRIVRSDSESLTIRFDVDDTGIGISAEQQAHLFEAFEQADVSITRKYGGTGLGLAISKRLALLMNGTIGCTSEPGLGSNFWVEIPLQRRDDVVWPQLPKEFDRATRVLVVDDLPEAREPLLEMLARVGLSVEAADSGEAALNAIVQADQAGSAIDLAFLDWKMPEMDGFEAAKRISELPLQHRPKLVMVSAASPLLTSDELTAAGFSGFLAKPVTPSSLFESLLEILHPLSASSSDWGAVSRAETELSAYSHAAILLVEDNPTNRIVATDLLEAAGLKADTANDGVDALEMVQQRRYDLVLMDMQMPRMDGLEATRAIRLLSGYQSVPIVAMTANAFFTDRERCLEAGMNDHVAKPVDPERLYETLLRHFRLAGLEPTDPRPQPLAEESRSSSNTALDGTLIDWPALQQRYAGRHEFIAKLLRTTIDYFRDTPEELEHLIAAADFEEIRRIAHGLKSTGGNLMSAQLKKLAEQTDASMRRRDPEGMEAARELKVVLSTLLSEGGAWLDENDTEKRDS